MADSSDSENDHITITQLWIVSFHWDFAERCIRELPKDATCYNRNRKEKWAVNDRYFKFRLRATFRPQIKISASILVRGKKSGLCVYRKVQ